MALELLAVWGVAQAAGFLFKPVLEDFAKDVVKDKAKDYVKGCFGNVFKSLHKDTLQKALANALKELLQLLQDELLDAGLAEKEVAAWNNDVKEFVRSKGVQTAMRQAFTTSDAAIDAGLLAQAWQEMAGPHPLPNIFDWSRIAKRFSRAVRSLRESDTELRQILQAQAAAESSQAQRQMGALPVDFELESYREALLESHRHLKLELLDTTGASYKVQLNSVFVPQSVRDCQEYVPQYFELPREHKLRLRQSGDLEEDLLRQSEEMIEERRQIYRDQSPRSVWELVNDDRAGNLVILGDPGSGKSTLLKAMALDWAQVDDATERYARPLPLLIELGSYDRWECASGKSFVRYLQDAQTTHRLDQFQLDRVLQRRGGAVLLLDGLDEIFDRNRRKDALNSIHEFSNKYRDTRIIVTSRVIGYEQRQLSDAGFSHFMLQDLDEAQIADFLDRWYATFVPDARERKAKQERIADSIKESRAIRELADNPLLLTMMSFLNLHQVLPRDRVKLYERMTEVLLHQWDFERLGIKGVVEYPEKAEMLRRLAHLMQNAPAGLKGNIIAGDELKKIFRKYLQDELGLPNAYDATNKLLEQLRERNFILCHLGADKYAFVHRTFLEYFCAAALVRQALKEDSSLEFLKTEVFGKRWPDESWHEVLRLIAGMDEQVPVEYVAATIDYLLEQESEDESFHNIFLAADCCREVRNPRMLGNVWLRVGLALENLLNYRFLSHTFSSDPEHNRQVNIDARILAALVDQQFIDDPINWLKDCARNHNSFRAFAKSVMLKRS
jgi:GTPase SAR1 family protein